MARLAIRATGDKSRRENVTAGECIRVSFCDGNTELYRLKFEQGMLTAYPLHDTDTPGVYNHSLLWNEYTAYKRKKENVKRKSDTHSA